jgi:hypothetical protein
MITLQYFNGKEWVNAGQSQNEHIAWISLGGDNLNYRAINENGKVLSDKSIKPKKIIL